MGENEPSEKKKKKVIIWPLGKKKHGYLEFGLRKGKSIPCRCATCDDITRCIAAFANISRHKTHGEYKWSGYNCRSWVNNAIKKCCLSKLSTP